MMPSKQNPTFPKFRDNKVKKAIKRLNNKSKKKNKKNGSYTQSLAKAIKRRNKSKNRTGQGIKRKLDFQQAKKLQQQLHQEVNQQLPKPKFYRNQKQAAGSKTLLNETIEDGEVIEEIGSSDDDDCIVLEPVVSKINLVDNEDSNSEDLSKFDNIPTSSRFAIDKKRDVNLPWKSDFGKANNGLMYSINSSSLMSDSSCYLLDDSCDSSPGYFDDRNPVQKVEVQLKECLDDSVIFIENKDDFIPLPIELPKPKEKVREIPKATPKMIRQRMNESLFTTTERKKLDDYNSNTYNPGVSSDNAHITHKRPIIIDGSNVAFGHGCSKVFSAEGIKYCVEYFQKMGHDVKAVIPLFRRNPFKSSNPPLLDQLHKDGKIVFTPCKNLPNQQSISYDDRFILQLAYERNAAVVSNDNYRDLIHENPAFKKIIENRVIGYSWCDNILIIPKDPYGRFGPPLAEILRC